MQSWKTAAQVTDGSAFVCAGIVPDDDNIAAQMAQKTADERADLLLSDRVEMQVEIQP